MKTKHILLVGGPASGKGTQAQIFIDQGYIHLSTGNLLRAVSEEKSENGQRIKALLATGKLFPDEEMFALVKDELTKQFQKNPETKVLFDGFPRTIPQAEFLDATLKEFNQTLDTVLYIEVSGKTMFNRMMERGKISGRTDDIDPDTINRRIDVYYKQTLPIIGYYQEFDKVIKINGELSIAEVSEEILTKVAKTTFV